MNEELSRLLREIAAEARATAVYTGIAAFAPAVMARLVKQVRGESPVCMNPVKVGR